MRKRFSAWLDNEQHLAYVILAPVLVLLLGFAYYPAFQSFKFSMLRYNLKMPNRIKFNGLDNYIYVLKDPVFIASVLRVLYFMAVATIVVMLISLGISLVLNKRFRGRGILRAIVIIPWALPPVVNGHLWKWIFNGDYGALNGLLYQLGIIEDYQFWLNNSFVALNLAVFLFVWRYTPFITILFLGVLQSVPEQLYEAAEVDGAGIFRQFYYITLSSLSRIGGIAVILTLIASFNVFDGIYALMEFSESTKTPMIYNYELTFEMGRFGRGSAMAYLVGFFLFIMTLFYIRISFRKDKI
ncbi:MAG: sugar ABC transporter permease [Spirochaetales bacterium]|nr:sugar ABC transporter permease [Spirochaetales bacterium]